jgi:hypothetical protein
MRKVTIILVLLVFCVVWISSCGATAKSVARSANTGNCKCTENCEVHDTSSEVSQSSDACVCGCDKS